MRTQLLTARLLALPRFSGSLAGLVLLLIPLTASAQRGRGAADMAPAKTIRVQTLPKAIVWMDEVKRGTADDSGMLEINQVRLRRHTVRVRAAGFKELTRALALPLPSTVTIKPTLRADAAELSFQAAEAAELTAKDDATRQAVVDLYKKALAARRIYPEAHLGLARVLSELGDGDAALEQIEDARQDRPNYAEASAVEGRILRTQFDAAGATAAFKRSIREARGVQPEAHTGLALVYQDQGNEEAAAAEFELAIDQLSDTEPIIYQLLGATYEKLEKYPQAVAAYEKYLKLAPNGNLAPAIRSMIDQLRRQAKGETPLN
jgi:tetratricopeptide (TPR) repeat protein